MSSKKKKLIIAASAGIITALRKAYELINEGGHLPEIEDIALPSVANHIVKALALELADIEENERFEGLDYEEIVELKDAERKEQLLALRDKAGQLLKFLREPDPVPDVEELNDDLELEINEDPGDDPDVGTDLDSDQQEDLGSELDEDSVVVE